MIAFICKLTLQPLIFTQVLDLSGCKLENLPDNFLNAPKYLEFLDLSDNDFMKIPAALGMAHALEILRFDTNPLNDLYISKWVSYYDYLEAFCYHLASS